MAKPVHYLDQLKLVLTDARKVSPYLTKDLKLSQGVANRVLNKERPADELLLRRLFALENVSMNWLLEGKGEMFHVTRFETAEETEEHVREVAHEAGGGQSDLYVVLGDDLAALVFSTPARDLPMVAGEEPFSYSEVEVIGGALTFDHAQMLAASGLPVRELRLATIDGALVKELRDGKIGTFRLFGSKTFGVGGILSHAAKFPQPFKLAAERVQPYLVGKQTGPKSRTRK